METTELDMFRETVQYSGQNIWIKPVCEFFEISLQNQQRKIKNDSILGKLWIKKSADLSENENLEAKSAQDLGEIDSNGRILLSKKGFVRWIQIINPNTVADHLLDKFSFYQEFVFDYLYGSVHDEKQITNHYARLRKLERLYSKIGSEIKREKNLVSKLLGARYLQLDLFSETQPKELNS